MAIPVKDSNFISNVKGFISVVGHQDAGDPYLLYDFLHPSPDLPLDLHQFRQTLFAGRKAKIVAIKYRESQ